MPDGVEQLRRVARGLKEAGTEGKGLRKELTAKINEAAAELVKTISDVEHLKPYMPDRYAEVLAADLSVGKRSLVLGANPRVRITAKGREKRREVVRLDAGSIRHPVFANPEQSRRKWRWVGQTKGMKRGFFTDACKEATPKIREKVLAAITETEKQITGRG
jgi:hypothetical protein